MAGKLVRCAACQAELGTEIDAIVTFYADQYPSLAHTYQTLYDDERGRRFVQAPCPVCGADNEWAGSGIRLRTS